MTDLEKLKARIQETEFPVGAKIKEGDIEVEVIDTDNINGLFSCDLCLFGKKKPCISIPCTSMERKDNTGVHFSLITNGN